MWEENSELIANGITMYFVSWSIGFRAGIYSHKSCTVSTRWVKQCSWFKTPCIDATVLTDQIHLSPRASSVVVHSLYVGNKVELSWAEPWLTWVAGMNILQESYNPLHYKISSFGLGSKRQKKVILFMKSPFQFCSLRCKIW